MTNVLFFEYFKTTLFTGSVVTSSEFDLTLMIALIRNLPSSVIPPRNGYDILPAPTEISDGDDLARIKFYRNMFAHPQKGEVDTVDFNSYWLDISAVSF